MTDYVASGQTASNFVLEGGQQFIVSGGSATGTTVSAGVQDIRNGATAAGAQISHDGTQQIEYLGRRRERYGGKELMATDKNVDAGGSKQRRHADRARRLSERLCGRYIIIDDGFDGGTQNLLSGATLSGVKIALGTQNVARGAAAGSTELATGGVQNVSAGGKAVRHLGGRRHAKRLRHCLRQPRSMAEARRTFGPAARSRARMWVFWRPRRRSQAGTAGGETVLDGRRHTGCRCRWRRQSSCDGIRRRRSRTCCRALPSMAPPSGAGRRTSTAGAVAKQHRPRRRHPSDQQHNQYPVHSAPASGFNHSSTAAIPGTAQDTTIDGGGVQDIETGGLAIGSVLNGGSEYVEGGGTAYSTTISAGKLEVDSGGSVDGGVYFATGGRWDAAARRIRQTFYQIPFSIAGFAHGDRLDLSDIAFGAQTTLLSQRLPTTPPAH